MRITFVNDVEANFCNVDFDYARKNLKEIQDLTLRYDMVENNNAVLSCYENDIPTSII